MIPRPKELEWWPGPKIADKSLDVNQCSDVGLEFLGPAHEKSGTPERAAQRKSRLLPRGSGYFPCFAYQSALIGVKLFHFSGRSSSAKIAVTGQTGTHAPQSMHSVGWMYNCVSASKAGSSLRGWMQSTGQTST